MKRNLSMLLAGLLVLVMASPLYAAPDIKVNGQIRTRLRYWVDIDLDSNAKQANAAGLNNSDRRYFDIRTRFGVDAKLSDGVRAVIQLEKYHDFGNISPSSVDSSTNAGATTLATLSNSSQDPYIRQAYMDFAVPGLVEEGWRVQAGRSFFRLGHGFLWGNSLTGEDGLTLYGPLGPGNIKFRFAQSSNQSPSQAGRQRFFDNETSHWAVDYKFEVAEKQNLEIYFSGMLDKGVDRYAGTVGSATNIVLQEIGGGPVRHSDEYYIGTAYNGVAGPVALKFEGIYGFGNARRNVAFNSLGPCTLGAGSLNPSGAGALACTREDNITRSAIFVYGEATYKVIPAWNVALAFTFATGDDNPLDDTVDGFVAPHAEWTTSPTRVWTDSQFFDGNRTSRILGNSVTNRQFAFWGRGTVDIDRAFSTGDNGTPYSPGLFEGQFKTKYTFNKEVTGLFNVIPTWAANHPDGSGRYMGTEIDGKIAYKPFKNISLNGYFGVFFPGGFFDQGGALLSATTAAGNSATSDTAWMFRTEAIVTF